MVIEFGNQIDESTTTEALNITKQTEAQEITAEQNVTTDSVAPPSPGISNLTTDVRVNFYIRPPAHRKTTYTPTSQHTIVGYYPRKVAKDNLRHNSKPKANPNF